MESGLINEIKQHIKEAENFSSATDVVVYCTPTFYQKVINHWKIKLAYKILTLFPVEAVRVYATSKRGKKLWKLTGIVSGISVNVKRDNKLPNGEDFCWVFGETE